MNLRQKKLKNCFSYNLLFVLLGSMTVNLQAAEESVPAPPAENSTTQDQPAASPPPPLPPEEAKSDDSRNLPEPEVNIIHRKDATIEEYRINGRVRYAKIIPKKGKPYYLVDQDGDGILETRHNDLKGPPQVNQWIIKQW